MTTDTRFDKQVSVPAGFLYEDVSQNATRHIFYMEPCGKDTRTDIERWRIQLYYAPHFAVTHFEPSQNDYCKFLANHEDFVYAQDEYELFCIDCVVLDRLQDAKP